MTEVTIIILPWYVLLNWLPPEDVWRGVSGRPRRTCSTNSLSMPCFGLRVLFSDAGTQRSFSLSLPGSPSPPPLSQAHFPHLRTKKFLHGYTYTPTLPGFYKCSCGEWWKTELEGGAKAQRGSRRMWKGRPCRDWARATPPGLQQWGPTRSAAASASPTSPAPPAPPPRAEDLSPTSIYPFWLRHGAFPLLCLSVPVWKVRTEA